MTTTFTTKFRALVHSPDGDAIYGPWREELDQAVADADRLFVPNGDQEIETAVLPVVPTRQHGIHIVYNGEVVG